MVQMDSQSILDLLCSNAKLERDTGASKLFGLIQASSEESDLAEIITIVTQSLQTVDATGSTDQLWEHAFGILKAAQLLTEANLLDSKLVRDTALACISHNEFRVRICAGEVLGAICKAESAESYLHFKDVLFSSISENLKREIPEDLSQATTIKSAKEIFHDTAGWKNLETSMKGLQAVINGCGPEFLNYVSQDLLDLIFSTLNHTNRFVRETGYYLCAALAHYNVASAANKDPSTKINSESVAYQIAKHLANGLSDNWSQVRLAASTATRFFFDNMSTDEKETYLPLLLPSMCLNRYYLAEGVRIYNQETWRQVLGNDGKHYVEKYISEMVSFYTAQTDCDNHAVREAACHCMTELACKVDAAAVMQHIPRLLDALHVCFKDDSWPVRDTACVACGKFIAAYPVECKNLLEDLYPLFYANLADPIPSVRQGGALSLADIASAYGEAESTKILKHVQEGLQAITDQKENIDRYTGLDKGPGDYGVVKHLRDNDISLHSNQQMYSCGSLAPKMGKGGGGCSDHTFRRPSQPWEKTDGCILLLASLANNKALQTNVLGLLQEFSKALQFKGYTQRDCLLETACSVLPNIAIALGKRPFKNHLESFLDSLHDAFNSGSALTNVAARDCLIKLSQFIGPNIMRGRIEQYNPSYLNMCQNI